MNYQAMKTREQLSLYLSVQSSENSESTKATSSVIPTIQYFGKGTQQKDQQLQGI